MKKLLVLVGCLAAVAAVRGDIIPSFTGTSPASGTNTTWNYQIDITTDQQVTAGDFFTIYDFGPFIAGTNVQPTGWTFSSSLVGVTPNGVTPPDSATLENLTWTYTGSTPITSSTGLGPFSITVATTQFQEAPSTQSGYFAAQATRASAPNGTKINNVGRVSVPAPVPVPEPTTLSLLIAAGGGAALRRIRRRK